MMGRRFVRLERGWKNSIDWAQSILVYRGSKVGFLMSRLVGGVDCDGGIILTR
jgi:hypothetical protein